MTIMEMLGQSGVLTLLGLGIVFVFLILLITVVTIVGKIFSKGLASSTHSTSTGAGLTTTADADNNARTIAAISAAVTEYRKTN